MTTTTSLMFLVILFLVYVIACVFIVYHLFKFGIGIETRILAIVFMVGVITLTILAYSTGSKITIL